MNSVQPSDEVLLSWLIVYGILRLWLPYMGQFIYCWHCSFFNSTLTLCFHHLPLLSGAEHGDIRGKVSALKKVIQLVLNGERLPGLLMTIIRFLLPSNDHQIKKLLLIFWEIWPKTSPDGKLLHEMILVCDAYRKVGLGSSVSVCSM